MQITNQYLEGWYKKSTPLLHHFLKRWSSGLSSQDREDIISESMLILLSKIDKSGIEVANDRAFNSYVFCVLKTTTLTNFIRSRRNSTEDLDLSMADYIPEIFEEDQPESNVDLIAKSKEILYKIPPSLQEKIIFDRVENKLSKEKIVAKYRKSKVSIKKILDGTYVDNNAIYVDILDAKIAKLKVKDIAKEFNQTPQAIERKLYYRINKKLKNHLHELN